MSISKKLIVTLRDDVATPKEKMFVYKNDVGVDIIIELDQFTYNIDMVNSKNRFGSAEAHFKKPSGEVVKYRDNVKIINGNKLQFSFTKTTIIDMQEIGMYELQFRLFDRQKNRLTLPTYYFYIKKPLDDDGVEADPTGIVDASYVDFSVVTNEIELFAIEDGYIKTKWESGDLISSARLNKIEDQLFLVTDEINNVNNKGYVTETDIHSKGFATETYVMKKIVEAEFGVGIDLGNYVTKDELEDVSVFENDMSVVNSLGGITAGSTLNGLTALEILSKLLFPYVAPIISVQGTPNGGLYEKGDNQTITNVQIRVTKKSEKIIKLELFDGNELLAILEDASVEDGGTFSIDVNISVDSVNRQLRAVVTDATNKSYATYTNSFKFVSPYYVGVCNDGDVIDENLIKNLTKRVEDKGNKTITYTTNNQRMVFAYPSSYGNITKIYDANNFDVTTTFTRNGVSIIGLDGKSEDYAVYVNEPSTVNGFIIKFNY